MVDFVWLLLENNLLAQRDNRLDLLHGNPQERPSEPARPDEQRFQTARPGVAADLRDDPEASPVANNLEPVRLR
jgi:hypothetical protein